MLQKTVTEITANPILGNVRKSKKRLRVDA